MDHPDHAEAVAHLRRVDPVLGQLIDKVGRVTPGPRTEGTHFGAIARAIVFQQLSGQAAGTIHGRFEALFGGRAPTAEELLATPDEQLRAVGLSRAKAIYVKDLAQRVVDGALPVDRLHELEDAALLEALTGVKGIGRWTAQNVLALPARSAKCPARSRPGHPQGNPTRVWPAPHAHTATGPRPRCRVVSVCILCVLVSLAQLGAPRRTGYAQALADQND